MRRGGLRLFCALAFLACALAATAEGSSSSSADETPLPGFGQSKSENPFSRFEIVSLGSFPISVFYVDFFFDLARYFESDFDSSYLPLVSSTSLTDGQKWTRLGVALGVSCLVGAIDAVIHASKADAAKRLRAAQAEAAAASSASADAAAPQPASPPELSPQSGAAAPSAP